MYLTTITVNLNGFMFCLYSLIDFFKKIKRWAEMAKIDPDFQEKIDALERKFEVVSVIFQKYLKVFCDVFTKPEPAAKTTRHRAARKPQRLLIHPINKLLWMTSLLLTPLGINCVHVMKFFLLGGLSMFTLKVRTSFPPC